MLTLHDRALADIIVAKNCSSPSGNPTYDESIFDIAGYHVQQGIEKELKYILVEECQYKEEELKQISHDIDTLIDKVESETGITLSDGLKLMAREITDWEASARYGSSAIVIMENLNKGIEEFEILKDRYQEFRETKQDIEKQEAEEDYIDCQDSEGINNDDTDNEDDYTDDNNDSASMD